MVRGAEPARYLQVVDMFGSDMYVAAFIAVLVVMGLMKGADTCQSQHVVHLVVQRLVRSFLASNNMREHWHAGRCRSCEFCAQGHGLSDWLTSIV